MTQKSSKTKDIVKLWGPSELAKVLGITQYGVFQFYKRDNIGPHHFPKMVADAQIRAKDDKRFEIITFDYLHNVFGEKKTKSLEAA